MDPFLTIPEDAWSLTGEEGDEASRLLVTVVVCGTSLHLEAFRVTDVDGVQQPTRGLREGFEDWSRAASPDGSFETTRIFGADYVLFASPHC